MTSPHYQCGESLPDFFLFLHLYTFFQFPLSAIYVHLKLKLLIIFWSKYHPVIYSYLTHSSLTWQKLSHTCSHGAKYS